VRVEDVGLLRGVAQPTRDLTAEPEPDYALDELMDATQRANESGWRSTARRCAPLARRGEVCSRTQDTRNHRSAVILVGGVSVAAAVPDHR
jgi:hypothetical protein